MALSICIVIFKIKIFDAHFFLFSSHTTHITRHKKSVKIGVGLFLLTIFCYTSVILAVNSNLFVTTYALYLIYFNNFGNFFIYLWVDEKFRKYILRKK